MSEIVQIIAITALAISQWFVLRTIHKLIEQIEEVEILKEAFIKALEREDTENGEE